LEFGGLLEPEETGHLREKRDISELSVLPDETAI
jgi:hypothetical protein